MFQRTELTPAHRESLERLTESIFAEAVEVAAAGRGMEVSRLRTVIDTGPHTAAEAHGAGLVDRLGYRDEVYASLRSRVADGAELLFADRWHPARRPSLPRRRKGHVALVEVRGGDRSRADPAGDRRPPGRQRHRRRPAAGRPRGRTRPRRGAAGGLPGRLGRGVGGHLARGGPAPESGKPVIVSMSDVAASGGYYISCAAEVIVALPATLTGSIGVLGGKFVVRDLLERLGLTTGTVQQGERALMYSARRRFGEEERARLAATIDAVYADFVGKVARGRGRPEAEIEAVARGRVWTGRDALRGRAGRPARRPARGGRGGAYPRWAGRGRAGAARPAGAPAGPAGTGPEQRRPPRPAQPALADGSRPGRRPRCTWTGSPCGWTRSACADRGGLRSHLAGPTSSLGTPRQHSEELDGAESVRRPSRPAAYRPAAWPVRRRQRVPGAHRRGHTPDRHVPLDDDGGRAGRPNRRPGPGTSCTACRRRSTPGRSTALPPGPSSTPGSPG